MISLFIDTSLKDVSIGLVKDDKLLSVVKNSTPNEHSVYATKLLEDVLRTSNIKPNEVNEVIVVNGPGSFTGIRIGVTIAKMYAYLLNIDVKVISSLKARVIGLVGDYFLSIIDAKHGNYYIGLYDSKYNILLEEFNNEKRLEELVSKYNPIVVKENNEYDILKIFNYLKDSKGINPHAVNPIYLKLPEAMEHDKRNS